jgi:hypothetical protein
MRLRRKDGFPASRFHWSHHINVKLTKTASAASGLIVFRSVLGCFKSVLLLLQQHCKLPV